MIDRETILITGASSDIGCEIIRYFMEREKPTILAHYFHSEEKLKPFINDASRLIVPLQANLSLENDIFKLIKKVFQDYKSPDKIIHLAAPKIKNIRFKEINWKDYSNNIDVQLRSIILILKAFLPEMVKQGKGKILFILSSCISGVPPKAWSHYTSVKYALLGLMKSLAVEYADKKININAISPSMVKTRFLSEMPEKLLEIEEEKIPLKRLALPSDIAPLVYFLLSQEANYIIGENILVTGGRGF